MTRLYSDMTSADFVAWCARHGVKEKTCHKTLGIAREGFYRYRAGHPIPETIALLCAALDRISEYQSVNAVTLRDIERIMT